MAKLLNDAIALWPILVAAWLLAESDHYEIPAKVALQKSSSWRMIATVAVGSLVIWQLPYAITYSQNLNATAFAEELFLGCCGYVGTTLLGNFSLANRRRFEGKTPIET